MSTPRAAESLSEDMSNNDFEDHEHRRALLAEAHARPFHPLSAPGRLLHFAFMTDVTQAHADRAALDAYCAAHGQPGPGAAAKHHRLVCDAGALRWEQHAEFTTYTWEIEDCCDIGDRFMRMRQFPQPGPLLVAVDVLLTAERPSEFEPMFERPSLAMAFVDGGAAQAATDFEPDMDGFIRFVVVDSGLTPIRAGALVQRLLELETYRMFALLGLAEARGCCRRSSTLSARWPS